MRGFVASLHDRGDATAHPKKAPKSKAKTKAKAQLQVPKTIKEQLEDCRISV